MAVCQKLPKFSMHTNLSEFISNKNNSLGKHFLLKAFFDNLTFETLYFLKSCPIFHTLYSQNTIISFEYVNFWPKI